MEWRRHCGLRRTGWTRWRPETPRPGALGFATPAAPTMAKARRASLRRPAAPSHTTLPSVQGRPGCVSRVQCRPASLVRKIAQRAGATDLGSNSMPWAQAAEALTGATAPNRRPPGRVVPGNQLWPESEVTRVEVLSVVQPTDPSTKVVVRTPVPGEK